MLENLKKMTIPGLTITGTDTEVGKTVITCAISLALMHDENGKHTIGACKPIATGCIREQNGLVSEDALSLRQSTGAIHAMDHVNPVRYESPVAPAVAAIQSRQPIDDNAIEQALHYFNQHCDALLIEGIGGIMVPLDEENTVLDMMTAIDYPVVVVARAGLGTLNHTAMTVRLLLHADCRVAGIVMNGYDAQSADKGDVSMATNRQWIERITGIPVLAVVPRCDAPLVQPARNILDDRITNVINEVDWWSLAALPRNK